MIDSRLKKIADALAEVERRKKFNAKDFFVPYPRQQEFTDMGASMRERLLMAGNQLGKTEIGAFEAACHLTGQYPDWWLGRRWNRPVKAWAAGITSLSTRDVVQKKLFGEPGISSALGTGMVPKSCILDTSLARGITDAFDTVAIKHISGGTSVLKLKSYEQGREKWQGDTIDFLWDDEEPPQDIYSEGLARLKGDGMAYTTFTPLKGMSAVVMSFLLEESKDRSVTMMTIDDVTHFTPEEKEKRVAGYKPYEREARRNGTPMMGSGRIFTATEESISEDALSYIPDEWVFIWGIDFGIDHPFAAALLAWDRDADVIHVVHVIRLKGESGDEKSKPLFHAAAMKPFGWIPVSWPQDGHQRDKGSGEALSRIYKAHGLRMLDDHAKWPDGSNSTEAGLTEMDERMATGRFKVARHLKEFFEEYRIYHRKDGQIVKKNDDVLSAIRVAIMSKRFAKIRMSAPKRGKPGQVEIAEGIDFDVFQ